MREIHELEFRAGDGTPLFYRHWPGRTDRAIVLLHRGHEHSGRMAHIPEEIGLPDYSFFAWDARAHGRSGGEQGSRTTMSTFAADLDSFLRHIEKEHGVAAENAAVIAQSVGAVIAAAWAHDYAPKIRCLVLASPAFQVKLYVPLARLGLSFWHAVAGDFFVNSYVKPHALTHDPARIASYQSDPLIRRPISARVLLDLYRTAERVIADAGAINVPVQLLLSGRDWVVHNKPQRVFFERLGPAGKEIHTFEGFFHDTLGEKDRHLPLEKARLFIESQFAAPPARQSLRNADKEGLTKREYDGLRAPLPAHSPKAWAFAGMRLSMRTGGRLSEGIRLGLATGFDSGATLDYVYLNQPSGWSPLGKLVDWFYLNAIGWRGIRVRRQNLEASICQAAEALQAQGRPIRIADIAAGHGRYVLEALRKREIPASHVLLRDFDAGNVERGRSLIGSLGVTAEFEHGDAFDRDILAALTPKPTVGIVSGLYELFPDNALVSRSLHGLAAAIEPGGYILYTGQPWHPQLEMIARTLTSHRDGAPWIMRRRTQAEMDELVAAAGFRKVAQRIDEWGIFTVSIAERVRD